MVLECGLLHREEKRKKKCVSAVLLGTEYILPCAYIFVVGKVGFAFLQMSQRKGYSASFRHGNSSTTNFNLNASSTRRFLCAWSDQGYPLN